MQNSVKISSTEYLNFLFCCKFICCLWHYFKYLIFRESDWYFPGACPNNCNYLSVLCKMGSTKENQCVYFFLSLILSTSVKVITQMYMSSFENFAFPILPWLTYFVVDLPPSAQVSIMIIKTCFFVWWK